MELVPLVHADDAAEGAAGMCQELLDDMHWYTEASASARE